MLRANTTYSYSDVENEFDVPFEYIEGTEQLVIKGDHAWLGVLAQDYDMEDPFKTWYQGEVVEAPRYGFDTDDMRRVVRANPGRVYWVRDNIPELVTVKDTKSKDFDVLDWEKYYICPDDAGEGYAEAVWKEYRRWLEGECFGVAVWEYVKTGSGWEFQEDSHDSECWGYIGREYAEEAMKALMPKEEPNATENNNS